MILFFKENLKDTTVKETEPKCPSSLLEKSTNVENYPKMFQDHLELRDFEMNPKKGYYCTIWHKLGGVGTSFWFKPLCVFNDSIIFYRSDEMYDPNWRFLLQIDRKYCSVGMVVDTRPMACSTPHNVLEVNILSDTKEIPYRFITRKEIFEKAKKEVACFPIEIPKYLEKDWTEAFRFENRAYSLNSLLDK